MKIRMLEFFSRQKSAQLIENTGHREQAGERLRLLAKITNDCGWSGEGARAARDRCLWLWTVFDCAHEPL
jgi:hypothetical protein